MCIESNGLLKLAIQKHWKWKKKYRSDDFLRNSSGIAKKIHRIQQLEAQQVITEWAKETFLHVDQHGERRTTN